MSYVEGSMAATKPTMIAGIPNVQENNSLNRAMYKSGLSTQPDKVSWLVLINQARGPYWENIARGLSGTDRARAIFSRYGPKLVRVNKKFIILLCLTTNYLKIEPWRNWNEWNSLPESIQNPVVFSHTQKNYIAQERVKTYKETASCHVALNHSNFFNQMYFNIFYIPALPAGH